MNNSFCINGEVTELYLKGRSGACRITLIDTIDLPKVQSFAGNWVASDIRRSGKYYAIGNRQLSASEIAERRVKRPAEVIALHRFILDAPKAQQVDHKNHDTLDNRRCNIRPVSASINALNRARQQAGFRDENGKFIACVAFMGKRYMLGKFDRQEESVIAMAGARVFIDSHFSESPIVAPQELVA